MHILFLTDNFPPEVNAPASRTFDHAREWVKAGEKVTVITCAPNFPDGRVYDGYRNKLWQSEIVDGIRVIRVWSFIAANDGFTKRIIDYTSYMLTSFFASLFVSKVDVVVGTSPQFFTVVSAWMVAGFKRTPFVFELRDLWPDSIRAVGAMRESRVLKSLEKLELFLYRRADAIVSVTHSFKSNLEKRGIHGKKIHVITNGVNKEKFYFVQKDRHLLSELGLEGKFVAGYIGTHGMAHYLENILEAASLIQNHELGQNIRFLFLGGGATKSEIELLAGKMQLKNIIFLDTVPKSEVTRYWSILDIAIINLRKNDVFKSVIPSKMFEAMGMGIPILHAVQGESAEIVSSTGAGIVVEPENSNFLCAELLQLSQNLGILTKMSQNGQSASFAFDRKKLADNMRVVLEGLTR